MYSDEHKLYLKKIKTNNIFINITKFSILLFFLLFWEFSSRNGLINTFLFSSPSMIIKTIVSLIQKNDLLSHVFVTLYETILSFSIASILGLLIASILWSNEFVAKIFDPYLTIINSLPKVSLGPLIIIWVGANTNSIIFIAILISIFTTIINMYNAFILTDKNKIFLLKSFNATKLQIFTKLILKSNIKTLLSTLKINISLSLIGVIMGELLVSKKGLGYLITYGSQVFNLNLVITSVFILGVISYILYIIIDKIEKKQNLN